MEKYIVCSHIVNLFHGLLTDERIVHVTRFILHTNTVFLTAAVMKSEHTTRFSN